MPETGQGIEDTFVEHIFNHLLAQLALVGLRCIVPPVFWKLETLRENANLASDKC